jgi:membrane-bound ClpP family serine protease
MRLMAISLLVLAGAVMAAAGTIAEALPDARYFNDLDIWGLILVVFGSLLFLVQIFRDDEADPVVGLSMLVLAGAILASAGIIAEALPGVQQFNQLDIWGLVLAGLSLVLFVIALFRDRDSEAITSP